MTRRTILIVALAAASGCGPTPGAAPEGEPSPVEQVGQLLRTCNEMGKPAPRTLKEAEKLPGASPKAIEALNSGAVVIYWGVNLNEYGGASVIGYEKDAPEKGGAVILGDGTVTELAAEQFREIPKPPEALLKQGASPRAKGSR